MGRFVPSCWGDFWAHLVQTQDRICGQRKTQRDDCEIRELPLSIIRMSQCSVYPALGDGQPIDRFTDVLRNEGWDRDCPPPRAVVWHEGFVQTWDHRRVICARLAGMTTLPFQVFRADALLPSPEDDPFVQAQLRVEVSERLRQEAVVLVGSRSPFRPDDKMDLGTRAKTWGEAVVFRSALQVKFGDTSFPLVGKLGLPHVQWDFLPEYEAHCARISRLPVGGAPVYFTPKRQSMFLRRSTVDLASWMQANLENRGTAKIHGRSCLIFHEDWQEVAVYLARWCGEVLPSHDMSFDPALNLAFVAPSVIVTSLPEAFAHAVAAGDEIRFDVEEVVELSAQETLEGCLMLPSIDDTTASSERVGRRCVAVRVRFEGGGAVPSCGLAAIAWERI